MLFISCKQPIPKEITKIELAEGPCFGSCIPMAVSIDSSLKYAFYEDSSFTWNKIKPKKPIVSDIGVANRQLWNNVINLLDSIDYKHLASLTQLKELDGQDMELIVYCGRNKFRIVNRDDKTEKIINLFETINKQVKLSPTIDTLNFGTTVQWGFKHRKLLKNKSKK